MWYSTDIAIYGIHRTQYGVFESPSKAFISFPLDSFVAFKPLSAFYFAPRSLGVTDSLKKHGSLKYVSEEDKSALVANERLRLLEEEAELMKLKQLLEQRPQSSKHSSESDHSWSDGAPRGRSRERRSGSDRQLMNQVSVNHFLLVAPV